MSKTSAFSQLIEEAISRRSFLKTGAAFGVTSFVTSTARVLAHGAPAQTQPAPKIGFTPVAANTTDTITLPPGYRWQVVVAWGDPLFARGAPFNQTTRGTGASQELAFGDNNDGMAFYPLSKDHGVLAVNNEYSNIRLSAPAGFKTADDIRKGKAAHGISVVELRRGAAGWKVVIDGKYNRRITADSPMEITGPARGHAAMKTSADPSGTRSLGTWNNCGNGRTPWGTYLTCEENFNSYFASCDPEFELPATHKRYGIGLIDRGYNWYLFDPRFDISKEINEAHRSGYIVEIDPIDPNSTPKKRTALGRFKHENAGLVISRDGRVVVYMGDDERGEYLYRFISRDKYKPGADQTNRDLLENGTLYVARFGAANEDLAGTGKWIELSLGKNGLTKSTGFESAADIAIFTRAAATLVGATTMDRPEWVVVNPGKAEVYCALTNNKNRGGKPNAGGAPTPVNGPNPRAGNVYGQILRWRPSNGDHTAETFAWNLFALAGNPTVHKDLNAGSKNITADNMFNSPDGLAIDNDGRLWIQTDGNYKNKGDFAGMGNNQMLCADPASGAIKRFMVGPSQCEITGSSWTADQTTMFVGIQHPGESGSGSHFPDGGDSVPRSAVVAIWREDGGVVGT